MDIAIEILKGIHPGFVLERELEKRKLRKNNFAAMLNEHAQTLTAITKGKRSMNTGLALKIENKLGIEEGFFMILQVYYDIAQQKKKQHTTHPDLQLFRPILFWDTKMESIDWLKQKNAVIKRIFERGNDLEKKEITRFYGSQEITKALKK